MAIRSTNANRASRAYNPAAKPQGGVSAGDRADFGQGPPGRMTKKEQWDRRVDDYGMSPWYGKDGNPMPWSGPPGQQHGQRTPFFTPDAGDPRNAGYWKNQMTPEEAAAAEADARQRFSDQKSALMQDPRYSSAWDAYQSVKGSGGRDEANAMKAVLAAETAAKQRAQRDRFIAQGGTGETWDNRFNTSWPVPRSRNGQYWYRPPGANGPGDPGRPGPTPPNVAQSAPAGPRRGATPQANAVPPQQNAMMQGYLGGGAGVGGSGWGSAGGYNPGQSKSGMGQSPMSGPAMSTGNPMGGMEGGGIPPQLMQMLFAQRGYNPMAGGSGMGGMGFGGFGGFNPYSMLGGGMGMGYNPGAQFSPYMMMGGY